MQTTYEVLQPKGVEGMPSADRRSDPMTLPELEQITDLTSTGGSGTDDLVVTIVDDETSDSYSFTAAGSATEATVLANALAAFALTDQLPLLFDLSDGGTGADVVLRFAAKHANRSYTISATGGPGGSNSASNVQDPGGQGVEFGRFVRRGAEDRTFEALAAATAAGEIAGVLFRTDANHFRLTDGDTPTTVDRAERGKTYAIMKQGKFLAVVEGSVAPGNAVHVRRAAGTIGRVRATADSTNTVDISAYAAFDESGSDGELVWVKVDMGAQ